MKTYARIKEAGIDIVQCNDCGAYINKKDDVVHHNSCRDGESKKWGGIY